MDLGFITVSELIGTVGVSLLLIAFFMNLFGLIGRQTFKYLLLNLVGAAMACSASLLIEFFPFVILEGTWTVVAIVGLVKVLTMKLRVSNT